MGRNARAASGVGILLAAALAWLSAAPATGEEAAEAAMAGIFARWNRTDSPGCAVSALSGGEPLFRGAYGMANLEHGVPLTPDSIFRMASVSKQFTVAAVLRAEDLGLLTLDDPLRRHFPDLPEWAAPVRVRHLVHHTSGIRDYLVVMELAGYGEDAHYTDADVLAALRRLERLNFEPGTEYLYSNSGYWLLGRLVHRVSGTTLREFAAEHLFRPLGMTRTFFFDDAREPVPGRAAGYRPRGGDSAGFEIDQTTLEMVGDGGLFTSVNELARWERMFLDPAAFGPGFVARLTEPGRFADGSPQDYAGGLVHGIHRGLATVGHGGGFVGYRTYHLRFPERDFAVFVLCNAASADPARLATEVAGHFLGESLDAPAGAAGEPADPVALSAARGAYYSDAAEALAVIGDGADGGLVLEAAGGALPLRREADGLAASGDDSGVRILPGPAGFAAGFTLRRRGQRDFAYRRVEPGGPTPGQLLDLAGRFFCRELDVAWEVRARLGPTGSPELTLVAPTGESPLAPAFVDLEGAAPAPVFRWRRGTVRFLPDPEEARPRGFELAAGRARGFTFLRVAGGED